MYVSKDTYQKLRFEEMQEKPTRFASCARAEFLVGSVALVFESQQPDKW